MSNAEDRMPVYFRPDVIDLDNLYILAGGVKYKLVRVDAIPLHQSERREEREEPVRNGALPPGQSPP